LIKRLKPFYRVAKSNLWCATKYEVSTHFLPLQAECHPNGTKIGIRPVYQEFVLQYGHNIIAYNIAYFPVFVHHSKGAESLIFCEQGIVKPYCIVLEKMLQ